MKITIRPEALTDSTAIRELNRVAFGTGDEAELVDALRAGGYVSLSLVAEANHEIVGHILFSKLSIVTSTETIEAFSLAPMAVLPCHQRQGIGSKLIVEGLTECRRIGAKIVVVLGHPKLYSRFGFSAALAKSLDSPFGCGEAWMAIELASGSMAGVTGRVEYPPPFAALA